MGCSPPAARIEIELARVADGAVRRDPLVLPASSTLAEALAQAVSRSLVTAEDVARLTPAVHGKLRAPGYVLNDGDRIELVGPLRADPKLARQRRVELRRAAAPRDKWRPGG
ncbi:MAG: RnfH family protein [Burkholderiaceae bacterium]